MGVGARLRGSLGWDRTAVIWIVGVFTALYTMKGGLRVVVYTDALQSVMLIAAAVVLTVVGLQRSAVGEPSRRASGRRCSKW